MPRLVALFVLFIPAALLSAQDKPDLDKLILVRKGDLPVVITAPHGGRLPVPGVPERKGDGVGKFVAVNDTNTDLLAEKLADAIKKEMGGQPHLIVARFERKGVDANRPAKEGYETDAAKPVYDAYHAAVKAACADVTKTWGRGILLDLHGQAAKADTIFRGTRDLKTVGLLKDRSGKKAITGPDSVLGVLAKKGYAIVPANDSDDAEDKRFNGGYTVGTYGTESGVDAIQLELGGDFRAKTKLDTTAADLAAAVKVFAKEYLPSEKRK